jgi:hypothetical protein
MPEFSPGQFLGSSGFKNFKWFEPELAGEGETPEAPTDQTEVHKRIGMVCQYLRDRQVLRQQYNLLYARIYGNLRFLGFGPTTYTQTAGLEDSRITLNMAQNMVDAVVSRITRNKPKATVVTDGQDFSLQRRAKNLEAFIAGVFHKTKFRKKAIDAFRNCAIYGTGALKIYKNYTTNEPEVEHVPPWMLVVDDTEALHGPPRNLYERRYIDREIVIQSFAEGKEDIEELIRKCPLETDEVQNFAHDNSADQLLVTESWHLPSSPTAKDGRHCITISNCTLVDELYEYDHFPHIFIKFGTAPAGFFGLGLVGKLIGLQQEVNKLLRQIQQAHQLCAWPRIYVKRGSKVIKTHLNNEIGGIVEYDDVPPQQASFPVVPQEVYNHLKWLYEKGYEVSGISQLEATSQKPAGVESGIAMRTLQDVQTTRFSELGENWENLFADGAERLVEVCREIAAKDKNFGIKAINKDELGSYSWTDADMDLDAYRLQVFPTSAMPDEPAGKLQWVEDLSRAGNIDPEDAFDLLDFPDTKQYTRRRRAGRDVIDRSLERMLYDGEYTSPEPFDNLAYALRRAQETYDIGRLQGAPVENLELLQRYMVTAQALLKSSLPPNPQAPPPAP